MTIQNMCKNIKRSNRGKLSNANIDFTDIIVEKIPGKQPMPRQTGKALNSKKNERILWVALVEKS